MIVGASNTRVIVCDIGLMRREGTEEEGLKDDNNDNDDDDDLI